MQPKQMTEWADTLHDLNAHLLQGILVSTTLCTTLFFLMTELSNY